MSEKEQPMVDIAATLMVSPAVSALINRMKTNPKEFWSDNPKWRFIYSGNTKELLTEPEKAAIHTALMEVRRMEFQHLVMEAIIDSERDKKEEEQMEQTRRGNRYRMQSSTGI